MPSDVPANPAAHADARPAGARPAAEPWTVPFFHALNRVYTRGYHHVTVETPLDLPRAGPAMLVSNHISGLDPLLLESASRRPIVWMMAREYFDNPLLTWFFKAVRAIPVDRNGRDSAATRAALRALKDGHVLGVFPEGRIEKTRDLIPFHTGAAMMAARADVPVYPAYLDGSNRGQQMVEAFTRSNRVRLRFGSPLRMTSAAKADLDISTERLFNSVARLKKEMAYA